MYEPKEAIEVPDKTQLPKDTILDGVIVDIKDGKVNEFVPQQVEWKGDKASPCINLTIEVQQGEEIKEIVKIEQLFTYKLEDGKTAYTPKSNLGKYKIKYKKLPEAGDQVKIITNSDGFGKVKLD